MEPETRLADDIKTFLVATDIQTMSLGWRPRLPKLGSMADV